LTYVKNIREADTFFGGVNIKAYNLIEEEGPRKGELYQLVRLYMSNIQNRNPEQRFWIDCPDGSKVIPPGTTFPPERPNLGDGIWRWTRKKIEAEKDKIVIKKVKSSNLLNENNENASWNVFTKTYLNDVVDQSSAKPNSFIEDHINQISSHELRELEIPFDYAKPTTLIKYLATISKTKEDSIILDFFSGSASTAHAVMQLNAEDGGSRKFIMVQLPEKTDEKSEAFKAGYNNICEIGKERIRRAGEKVKNELVEKNQKAGMLEDSVDPENLDIGFKVYKLDSSNFNVFDSSSKDINNIFNHDVFLSDRSKLDILYEILLKYGVFDKPVEVLNINNKEAYSVAFGHMLVFINQEITEQDITEVVALKPREVIIDERGFKTDNDKMNAVIRLEAAGVEKISTI